MFHSILVPLDGTPESATAVPLARTVARATGGSLHLLTVTPCDSPNAQAVASVYLQATAALVCDAGVSVRTTNRVGDPAREIVRVALANKIDLVVMGSHKVNPARRKSRGWGTTSYKVGIFCQCPILLIK